MTRVLITGGTGLVGKSLSNMLLSKGYEVVLLSRHPTAAKPAPGLSYARWDVEKQELDKKVVSAADHIIHLAGAPVIAKRWTEAYKKEIVDSRTKSSELLVKMLQYENQVKTVISASAIGYYGPDPAPGASGFAETDPAAKNFLGETCRMWEESIEPASAYARVVKFRIGIVLSNDGGALQEFIKPIKFGVAAIIGNGNQVISWIHIDDLCRMFLHAIENTSLKGVYNAVAPAPVTNKELILLLGKQIRGNFAIPVHVPAFMLKLMLGKRSEEVLKSTTVTDAKIRSTGFEFLYNDIDAAVRNLR